MLENRVPRGIVGGRMRVATGEQGILLATLWLRPTPELNSRPFRVEFLRESRPFSDYCDIPHQNTTAFLLHSHSVMRVSNAI